MDRARRLTDHLPVVRHARQTNLPPKKTTERRKAKGSRAKTRNKQKKEDVPQPELSPLEKLVQFDLNFHFGPCTGITRMERWQRAQDLGLMPPQDIKQILLAHTADPDYQYK
ncbi:DNA polymerase delta subunit 4 [Gastrophryne carolinensis]